MFSKPIYTFLILLVLVTVVTIADHHKQPQNVIAAAIPTPIKVIVINPPCFNPLELPLNATGEFKAYMGWDAIKDKVTLQWFLQQFCWTDEHGFRRFNNKYVIAVGTGFATHVGQELKITLSTGVVFYAIVGDIKKDIHTDFTNRFVPCNGNIIEFLIDKKVMKQAVLDKGTISELSDMVGKVIKIEILDEREENK